MVLPQNRQSARGGSLSFPFVRQMFNLGQRIRGEIHFRTFRFLRSFPVRPGNLRQYAARPQRRENYPDLGNEYPGIAMVTPSYNQVDYLPRTIHSVISQDYPALDYCVMDGGSDDGSVQCLENLAASHGFHWTSGKDRGQADAINRGFAQVNGEVMAWLNSDDLLLPGALRFVGAYFAAHPDVDVVYGHRLLIDEKDEEIGQWIVPPYCSEALRYFDYVPQETLFWRRSLWEKVGGLDESFQFALDWDILLRFRAAGARFVRLPYFLGAFRIHPDQKTSTRIADSGRKEMRQLREIHGADAQKDRRMINLHNREMIRAFRTWALLKAGLRSEQW